jgi:hypothetical protein
MRKYTVAALAACLAIAPANATGTAGDDTGTTEQRDNDFPWGLLGLAGLAGLLGLKRRDDHDHHRGTTTGTRTDGRP